MSDFNLEETLLNYESILDEFIENYPRINTQEITSTKYEKPKKKFLEDLSLFVLDLTKSYLNKEKELKQEFEFFNSELIPKLFHRIMHYHFMKKRQYYYRSVFKKINFNTIYNIFYRANSGHFKILEETLNLFIEKLNEKDCEISWFDVSILKDNYGIIDKNESQLLFRFRTLILYLNQLDNKTFQDIRI